MFQNINLNLLKYYYEVVNDGNITKASERMMVSQPAITKAIKELENELNVKLLERSKKGVSTTEEGKVLYDSIKNIFMDFQSTINVLDMSYKSGGHLYIGATTTNFMIFIMDALKSFKELYPNVHIHIVLEKLPILNDMLRLGHLDIVIKTSYEIMQDYVPIKTFEIQDCFIASKKHFPSLAVGKHSLQELLQYPFVLLSDITNGRRNFDEYLKSKKIDFKPTYEFNSYSLCRELIKNGFGIGIGNPIHYMNDDFIIINTDFNLPRRAFEIGTVKTSSNKYIADFVKLIDKK